MPLRGAPAAALAIGFVLKQRLGLARPSSLSDKGTAIRQNNWRQETLCGSPFPGFVEFWLSLPANRQIQRPARLRPGLISTSPMFSRLRPIAPTPLAPLIATAKGLRIRGVNGRSDCLTAAVEADPSRLAALKVEDADVEAYFSPAKPQNAYLLIHAKNGVILAFRGTLTLPISPGNATRNGLVKEAIETFNVAVLKAFESYLRDWANNVVAFANERDRHAGFDHSWQELKEHLKIDCGPGAAKACSKFRSFTTAMGASPDQHLFLTGHSKGGALATLAALDIPELFEQTPKTTVYTFAAPKSLSQEGAANAAIRQRTYGGSKMSATLFQPCRWTARLFP